MMHVATAFGTADAILLTVTICSFPMEYLGIEYRGMEGFLNDHRQTA